MVLETTEAPNLGAARRLLLSGVWNRFYCGCCGAAVGGVGPSVGVEVGSAYQTKINASTTAAAMMSTLFVSMAFSPPSFLPTLQAKLMRLRQMKIMSNEDHYGAP